MLMAVFHVMFHVMQHQDVIYVMSYSCLIYVIECDMEVGRYRVLDKDNLGSVEVRTLSTKRPDRQFVNNKLDWI